MGDSKAFFQRECEHLVVVGQLSDEQVKQLQSEYSPRHLLLIGSDVRTYEALSRCFDCSVSVETKVIGLGFGKQIWNLYVPSRLSGPKNLAKIADMGNFTPNSRLHYPSINLNAALSKHNVTGSDNVFICLMPNVCEMLLGTADMYLFPETRFAKSVLHTFEQSFYRNIDSPHLKVIPRLERAGFEVKTDFSEYKNEVVLTIQMSEAQKELQMLKAQIDQTIANNQLTEHGNSRETGYYPLMLSKIFQRYQ